MNIIETKVNEVFNDFKESLENQQEMNECIKGLVTGLIDIADKSIDVAIAENFNTL